MKSKEEDICAGQTLLSPSGWEALHGEPVEGRLFTASFKFTQVSKLNSHRKCFRSVLTGCKKNSQGGVCQFEDEVSQGRGGFFGWMGFGG